MSERNEKPLVIYHDPCSDGWCAAWQMWHFFKGEVELYPTQYNQNPPEVTGREVYIVDFSYPRSVLELLHKQAESLLVLDHHVSAQKELEGLAYCKFQMDRSGAGMVWDWVGTKGTDKWIPSFWVVAYVQDRDLWTWKLRNSRTINQAIQSWPKQIEFWDRSFAPNAQASALMEGVAIERYLQELVQESLSKVRLSTLTVGEITYPVWVINTHPKLMSDTLEAALKSNLELIPTSRRVQGGPPFALGWSQQADGSYLYSLRSGSDFDVSKVAKHFGGGGHKQAAGFKHQNLLV